MYNIYQYNASLYNKHGTALYLTLTDTQSSAVILGVNPAIQALLDTLSELDSIQVTASRHVYLLDDVSVTQWFEYLIKDTPFYEVDN